jgi:hypothetical protein
VELWNGGFGSIDGGEPSGTLTQNICEYLLTAVVRP